MHQDPEVAQIIRNLDETKHEAVRQEHCDQAKKLKQAIADLQKVGERLGRYEVEKRCAVEREDYDLAKQKKQQMEEYRLRVYQQLELHHLLDPDLMILEGPIEGKQMWLSQLCLKSGAALVRCASELPEIDMA